MELECKAGEILANAEEILDNTGRVLCLTSYVIALSLRQILGGLNYLIQSIRNEHSRLCHGTVDLGARLDYEYKST